MQYTYYVIYIYIYITYSINIKYIAIPQDSSFLFSSPLDPSLLGPGLNPSGRVTPHRIDRGGGISDVGRLGTLPQLHDEGLDPGIAVGLIPRPRRWNPEESTPWFGGNDVGRREGRWKLWGRRHWLVITSV